MVICVLYSLPTIQEVRHVHAGAQFVGWRDRNIEDAARAAQFQARIDAEERIEPNDWMPAAYRKR